ncbi:MAG: RNA-binding S4 domain-containing protein [Muribaculaceae bacterium]|nr:RNA-binding S4 domain-containing protein [Muribaculaceae bacterium]
MEDEKKPKRPRIGLTPSPAASADGGEARYDKANYSGEHQSYTPGEQRPRPAYNQRQQGGYQQRPYNNQGSYPRPRTQSPYTQQRPAYNQRPYQRMDNASGAEEASSDNSTAAEGGYQPRQYNQGYQPRPRTQVGYNNRQQSGYGQQRQGGYNNRQQGQGGYNNRQQGGYGQQRHGGYNNRQQGGYGQQRQGGYNNRQQGGYGQQRQSQGGFNNHQQGGYGQQRQGSFNNRQQGHAGYNNNRRPQPNRFQPRPGKQFIPRPKQIDYVMNDFDPNEPIRLNKFMAGAGVCSRREADEHIVAGLVKVNGEVVTELGTKITAADVVEYEGKVVTPERKCYVLLNKPKDCVTTSDDPNGRTTVLDLVQNACRERIYPVGRLDRNTTGVLLLTNDGDLASKLTHPKYVKKKIYHVWTDKDIAEEDMQRIADGIELDDGEIHADAISYVTDTDRNQAGIEIHSGRNRIVRRIFEALGYRVTKLDRVYFAGLTKKNLPRGRWRYLTQEEVDYLRKGEFE